MEAFRSQNQAEKASNVKRSPLQEANPLPVGASFEFELEKHHAAVQEDLQAQAGGETKS